MRSEKAAKFDFWETPESVSSALCAMIENKEGAWLDPACGKGALIKALLKIGIPESSVKGIDIDPDNIEFCRNQFPKAEFRHADFLEIASSLKSENAVWNPPFSKWKEFALAVASISERSYAVLPNSWLRSGKFPSIASKVKEEKWSISYSAAFEVQQAISLFSFSAAERNSIEKINRAYFKGYEELERRFEAGETVSAFAERLSAKHAHGLVQPIAPSYSYSGWLPKGLKFSLPPFLRSPFSEEIIENQDYVLADSKLKSGKPIEELYVRRHANQFHKEGSLRKEIHILPADSAEELESLIAYYRRFPIEWLAKRAAFDCRKILLVPEEYAEKRKKKWRNLLDE